MSPNAIKHGFVCLFVCVFSVYQNTLHCNSGHITFEIASNRLKTYVSPGLADDVAKQCFYILALEANISYYEYY